VTLDKISHFRILKKIGAGGMGEVYLAQDTNLGRTVALKILPAEVSSDSERLRRFILEAKTASSLNHPNVAQIHEIGEADGMHFIVMEHVEGETLHNKIGGHPMNTEDLLHISIQVADALSVAHSKGIIHRDLKPSNIMIAHRSQVKVLDFGLAKLTATSQQDSLASTMAATETGVVVGTVPYMSPEQALGKKVDSRSDIFSFGDVLYEMASGQIPFAAETPTQVLAKILQTEPDAITRWNYNIPSELERIIRKCLEKDPERRYQTASDLRIDLQKLYSDLTNKTALPIVAKKFSYLPFALIALIMVLVGSIFLFTKQQNTKPATHEKVTLAVLPFTILGSNTENKHLGIGIADAIITRLASVKDIQLTPTSVILRYKDMPNYDVQKIARDLKVEKVLSGTIQQSGDQFRIGVQLVQATDNASMWGKQFNLTRQNLLDLEDDVAEEVSRALEVRISDSERKRLSQHYTNNTAAYDLNLLGRSQLLRYDKEGTLAAVDAFEKALAIDPKYALAQAGLAMACADMHLRYASSSDVKAWGERAEKEAYNAVKLDPNLAEAHLAIAAVARKGDFNWEKTIQESRKALELNSNLDLPHYFIAAAYYHLGLLDLSSQEIQQGLNISETNKAEALRTQGILALMNGNYAEAVRKLEEVQRISDKPISDSYLGLAYYYNHEEQKAIDTLKTLASSSSASASSRAKATLASFYAASGRKKEAQESIASVISTNYVDHHVAYSLGTAFAQLGQKDTALDWLDRAVDGGFACYPMYANDPLLKPLQTDAKFQQFLENQEAAMQSARNRYYQAID
jgi:serine/threonine protein kinase/Tfp pilus assembly protein PilF